MASGMYSSTTMGSAKQSVCVGDSKKATEEVKRKLEARLILGEFNLDEAPSFVPLFNDYATTWLATYATHNCKELTYERYAGSNS